MFLRQTIENILANMEGDTEVIAVADGSWPDPVIVDHPRVNILHYSESVGQRRATNDAAKLSRAKYVMKCDAHCAFDKGFDVKLMKNFEYDWTVILRMYNLHGFDWVCEDGHRRYQGPSGVCTECGKPTKMDIVWLPRLSRKTDFARFDKDLHFQYHSKYEKRPEAQGDIADTMCHVGACWAMHRERYWELGGLDENHGSWGQMGVEVSLKSWLSGGRQVVNKTTWFSHLFRTSGGDFGFPYPLSGKAVEHARKVSRDTWFNNKFEKQIHPLSWLLEKFWPVPGWEDKDLEEQKERERNAELTRKG
jgi:glycosyltransferase involved in cell wall biosynthesis